MKYLSLLFLSLFVFLAACSSVKEKLQRESIGLINDVAFNDPTYNNSNASNGFLVEHGNNIYGVTAKHILMIAKTDNMHFVDFEGELKEWRMHPKNDEMNYIIMDELLSTNRKDSLTWGYLFSNWDSFDDWLVFSVKENHSRHRALKFRSKPLEKGEKLFAIGWSYQDTSGSQRVYEYEFDHTEGNYHNLVQIEGPEKLGGLSGAPVVDERGDVVGLVTSGGEDEETKKVILEVTRAEHILEFISELK